MLFVLTKGFFDTIFLFYRSRKGMFTETHTAYSSER